MKRTFSQRIALNYLLATTVLIISTFLLIYLVVHHTVYSHLDEDLKAEYLEVSNSIVILADEPIFANPAEWDENEHGQIEVNPTFIQVTDTLGKVLKKTPNLQKTSLSILNDKTEETYFNSHLSGQVVRQFQNVLSDEKGLVIGYISVAIPLEESQLVLNNLLVTLLLLFPIVLVVLYFTSKFIAQKQIAPVKLLTNSAEKITQENLNERIPLPVVKDELYTLTTSINKLLDRLEGAVLREKQFSSNASHELRTPLSVLKGTLDLMIRKPRNNEYYIEKSTTCLTEVNRMSEMVDQLLLLARYENANDLVKITTVNLSEIIDAIIARNSAGIEQKSLTLDLQVEKDTTVYSDIFMVEQILENIFSNAVKYSPEESTIYIESSKSTGQVQLIIRDEGIGMNSEELAQIFQRFYRVDESRNATVKGYGLGLSIASRFADLLQIKIEVQSLPQKGSSFKLIFPLSF